MAAAAAASAGACAALTDNDDLCVAGPSYNSDPAASGSEKSTPKHGGKKNQRVTIKDNNPTYHRAVSNSTKDVIISVREKHGSFRAAVPCMPTPVALICCLLNIVAPGTGTLISAFACLCCGYAEIRPLMAFLWNILAALLQMLTFIFIVGWIWSIIWGMTFISLASEYAYTRQMRASKHAVLRSDSTRLE